MNRDLSGIFPPITTPFDSDGELLLDRFKENLRRWSEFKLSGIVVLGSNGESAFLSEEERLRLVRESRPLISADKTMIVGAGRESTRLTVQFIRKVADLGDRKSIRLNSSHTVISYAVFCLKKKKKTISDYIN